MLSRVLLLATGVLAAVQKRQATDSADFKSAADALISSYIPSSDYSVLSVSVASAASAASVTGDVNSLIYSALEAPSPPGWFQSAVPTAFATEINALESQISALRPTGSGSALPTPTVSETVVVVTGTNSAGSTFTSSYTTAVIPLTTTLTTTSAESTSTSSASGSGSSSGSAASGSGTSSKSGSNAVPTAVANHPVVAMVALVGLAVAL